MFLLHLLHLKLCIFLPELLTVHIWFCAFFTGYKANRRRWLNWVHIRQKNCFHISQLENVRNPNNLQYLQWRSKTLFPSAEICFYNCYKEQCQPFYSSDEEAVVFHLGVWGGVEQQQLLDTGLKNVLCLQSYVLLKHNVIQLLSATCLRVT